MVAAKTSALLLVFYGIACAQAPPATPMPPVERPVRGRTIVSNTLPAADLTFAKRYRYVGSQRVNLYGNADAEQHLFVEGADSGPVEAFYWVQFEHFFPTNNRTYDYVLNGTTDLGGLRFVFDIKSFPDYAGMQNEDAASDGAAISRLLAQHKLAFPKRAARVRMFHLPTTDHRSELMIIYGEAIPEGSSVPIGKEGIVLDTASPESAKLLLEHARKALTIRKR